MYLVDLSELVMSDVPRENVKIISSRETGEISDYTSFPNVEKIYDVIEVCHVRALSRLQYLSVVRMCGFGNKWSFVDDVLAVINSWKGSIRDMDIILYGDHHKFIMYYGELKILSYYYAALHPAIKKLIEYKALTGLTINTDIEIPLPSKLYHTVIEYRSHFHRDYVKTVIQTTLHLEVNTDEQNLNSFTEILLDTHSNRLERIDFPLSIKYLQRAMELYPNLEILGVLIASEEDIDIVLEWENDVELIIYHGDLPITKLIGRGYQFIPMIYYIAGVS